MITSIPLDRLMLSKLNVRHTERDADIAALAEDIAARGLKQNLVVVPAHFATGEAKDGWSDGFEVIAGGRRFQAMQLLVADGRLPAGWPAPCLIEGREEATETSLSENLHRVAMNAADEFAAFAQIIADSEKDGCTHDAAVQICAKRFGKSVAHVEGRLRLAALAPEILDALRADVIGVDAAKAYATNSDHELQRKVFALHEADKWRGHRASTVRSDMRGATLPLDAPLVQFVGLVGYQAAGGRVEAEMFMGQDGEQRCIDVKLLEKLAAEIAATTIPALAKSDGFKEGIFAPNRNALPKVPKGFERAWDYSGEPTKAQKKKSIAVYAIRHDGSGLDRVGRFKPKEKRETPQHQQETPEERTARERAYEIKEIAARLGVGPVAGTVLEGRTFWPNSRWVDRVHETIEGDFMVAVIVKVTKDELAAQMEAAETQYEAERVAKQSAATDDATTELADAED
jgi:ParB family transcriptional regulator, chromosome partitioning protein